MKPSLLLIALALALVSAHINIGTYAARILQANNAGGFIPLIIPPVKPLSDTDPEDGREPIVVPGSPLIPPVKPLSDTHPEDGREPIVVPGSPITPNKKTVEDVEGGSEPQLSPGTEPGQPTVIDDGTHGTKYFQISGLSPGLGHGTGPVLRGAAYAWIPGLGVGTGPLVVEDASYNWIPGTGEGGHGTGPVLAQKSDDGPIVIDDGNNGT